MDALFSIFNEIHYFGSQMGRIPNGFEYSYSKDRSRYMKLRYVALATFYASSL